MTWAAFTRRAYQAARTWGIQPSEFWRLSPCDWWAEFDAKMDEADRMEELTAKSGFAPKGGGGFSKAEWDKARRIHAEKMKAKK